MVHVTFLTPRSFEKAPRFFFKLLNCGLKHPVPYIHIYTAKQMIQSLE